MYNNYIPNNFGMNNNPNSMNMMNMGQLSTYQQPQQQQVQPQQNNGFNIQEFMKFVQQMKGKDPNQMLQQMLNNRQITQEQLNKATNQS